MFQISRIVNHESVRVKNEASAITEDSCSENDTNDASDLNEVRNWFLIFFSCLCMKEKLPITSLKRKSFQLSGKSRRSTNF